MPHLDKMLTARVVDKDWLEAHKEAWHALGASSLEPCILLSPDYVLPVLHHIPSAGMPLVIIVERQEEEKEEPILVGMVFLSIPSSKRTRILKGWYHEMGGESLGGILLDPAYAQEAMGRMIEEISRLFPHIWAIHIPSYPHPPHIKAFFAKISNENGYVHYDVQTHVRAYCPRLSLQESDVLQRWDAKYRARLRNLRRQLDRLGAVRLDVITDPHEMAEAAEKLIAMEASGWKMKTGMAMACFPHRPPCVREIMENFAARSACHIYRLRVDQKWVALNWVLSFGNRSILLKNAYVEAYQTYAPGRLLLAYVSECQAKRSDIEWTDSMTHAHNELLNKVWPDPLEICDMILFIRQDGISRGIFLIYMSIWRKIISIKKYIKQYYYNPIPLSRTELQQTPSFLSRCLKGILDGIRRKKIRE